MQNQVNPNAQTQHTYNTQRSKQANRNNQSGRSYQEIHDSHQSQRLPGAKALQRVSELPPDFDRSNLICLLSVLENHNFTYESDAEQLVKPQSFEDILTLVIHNPNDPMSKYQNAMKIYLGQKNVEKYIDTENINGKLASLRYAADPAYYVGMSDPEIAKAIVDKYEKCFGDFLKAMAISYPSYPESAGYVIGTQFANELEAMFGSYEAGMAAYREALYGNMNDSEVRAEIASKYPPMNEITLREYYEMVYEMRLFNVDDGLMSTLSTAMGVNTLEREELLDKTLDLNFILDAYNIMNNAFDDHIREIVKGTDKVLFELFSISIDADGNAFTNNKSLFDFKALIEELTAKYFSWTISDFENLRDTL